MFDPRNNLANEVSAQLIEHFGEKVFRTMIPRNIRLAEAPSFGKPALFHDKESRGALAYLALAGEMIRRDEMPAGVPPYNPPIDSSGNSSMSGKKPSLGRGLAELSPLLARRAGMPEAADLPSAGRRSAREPAARPAAARQVSAARGHAARVLGRARRLDQVPGTGAADPGAPAPGPRPPASRSAMKSSPASGAGAPRRWRDSPEIPAIIRDVPDEAAVAMALIENIQREDLNPLEEARALSRLIEEFGLTHQAAAEAVGRSRAAVSNLLRLMELADEVKQLLEQRSIEMGHARALLGLTSRRQQIEVASLVAKKSLSVRETEALVRRLLAPPPAEGSAPRPG